MIVPRLIAGAFYGAHRPDCPGPVWKVRAGTPLPMLFCSACNGRARPIGDRWRVVLHEVNSGLVLPDEAGYSVPADPDEDELEDEDDSAEEPVPAAAGVRPGITVWWCRTHPDRQVDGRGRGCPDCARTDAARERARAKDRPGKPHPQYYAYV